MKKDRELNPDTFERMLSWLDDNRDAAGLKYEKLRLRLVRLFEFRQCPDSLELADQVFDRVARKLDEIHTGYVGDPTPYFLSVAHFIYRESLRKRRTVELPDEIGVYLPEEETGNQPYYDCLRHCISKLTDEKRQIILGYYQNERRAKIDLRQRLADSLGVTINTLHSKAFRIRQRLRDCVVACVAKTA